MVAARRREVRLTALRRATAARTLTKAVRSIARMVAARRREVRLTALRKAAAAWTLTKAVRSVARMVVAARRREVRLTALRRAAAARTLTKAVRSLARMAAATTAVGAPPTVTAETTAVCATSSVSLPVTAATTASVLRDVKSKAISGLKSAGRFDSPLNEVEVQCASDGRRCFVCYLDDLKCGKFKEAKLPVYLQLRIEGKEHRLVYGDTFDYDKRYVAILGSNNSMQLVIRSHAWLNILYNFLGFTVCYDNNVKTLQCHCYEYDQVEEQYRVVIHGVDSIVEMVESIDSKPIDYASLDCFVGDKRKRTSLKAKVLFIFINVLHVYIRQ